MNGRLLRAAVLFLVQDLKTERTLCYHYHINTHIIFCMHLARTKTAHLQPHINEECSSNKAIKPFEIEFKNMNAIFANIAILLNISFNF